MKREKKTWQTLSCLREIVWSIPLGYGDFCWDFLPHSFSKKYKVYFLYARVRFSGAERIVSIEIGTRLNAGNYMEPKRNKLSFLNRLGPEQMFLSKHHTSWLRESNLGISGGERSYFKNFDLFFRFL